MHGGSYRHAECGGLPQAALGGMRGEAVHAGVLPSQPHEPDPKLVVSLLQPREKGRMRFHRLQNVQIALDFLKQRQVRANLGSSGRRAG